MAETTMQYRIARRVKGGPYGRPHGPWEPVFAGSEHDTALTVARARMRLLNEEAVARVETSVIVGLAEYRLETRSVTVTEWTEVGG